MELQSRQRSILSVDFGSIHTRLVLLSMVEGQYRVVSRAHMRTTLGNPVNNVAMGLSHAIENLQAITDRLLIDEEENILIIPEAPDGSGVDALVATSSAGRPMQAVIVGIMEDVSITSARRALNGSYVQETAHLSIIDIQDEETQINAIMNVNPDVIIISGGTDSGNTDLLRPLIEVVRLSVRLVPPEKRPIVIYAGNQELAPYVEQAMQDDETIVLVTRNVRPDIETEEPTSASQALALAYNTFMSRQPGGFEDIAFYSDLEGLIPTVQSISNIVRWMGETTFSDNAILHIDIGSTTSTMILDSNQHLETTVHSELGLGHSIVTAMDVLNIERILQWLPFGLSEEELRTYAHNKALMPGTIPQAERDILIEQAITREIIQHMMHTLRTHHDILPAQGKLPAFDPIIMAGSSLTDSIHPGIAILMVLDALQNAGLNTFYSDPFAILPALGGVAYLSPVAAVQAFESFPLVYLGAVFCPEGRAPDPDKKAITVRITMDDGETREEIINGGEIRAIPIAPEKQVTLDLILHGDLRLHKKRRLKQQTVRSGTAGIIFDARGRPLPPLLASEKPATYAQWVAGVSGLPAPRWADRYTVPEEIIINSDALSEQELQNLLDSAETVEAFDEPDIMDFGLATEEEEQASKKKKKKNRRRSRKERRQQKQAQEESEAQPAPAEGKTEQASEEFPDFDDLLDRF